MSWSPAPPPEAIDPDASDIDLVIETRKRDLGGFEVGRVLPSPRRRLVGPFLFFDEMGPAEIAEIAVRPHPHINLATVTYLFEGEIVHRDSLGSKQVIRPGAVNSERSPESVPRGRMHGIQLWCGLPVEHEETEPMFEHYPADVLPQVTVGGAVIRVLAGEAYGRRSPVKTLSQLFYVDVHAREATTIAVPDYPERAAYAVAGTFQCGDQIFDRGAMAVFRGGRRIELQLAAGTRMVLLGGQPIGARHMYWNFVSSSRERIEQAKEDWRERRFPVVPGDEVEFIPLPE